MDFVQNKVCNSIRCDKARFNLISLLSSLHFCVFDVINQVVTWSEACVCLSEVCSFERQSEISETV